MSIMESKHYFKLLIYKFLLIFNFIDGQSIEFNEEIRKKLTNAGISLDEAKNIMNSEDIDLQSQGNNYNNRMNKLRGY